jgi:hypothetical protein
MEFMTRVDTISIIEMTWTTQDKTARTQDNITQDNSRQHTWFFVIFFRLVSGEDGSVKGRNLGALLTADLIAVEEAALKGSLAYPN